TTTTRREFDWPRHQAHTARAAINPLGLAPTLAPSADPPPPLNSEKRRAPLANRMPPPWDACPDVSRPINRDAGLICSTSSNEGGHGANIEHALNQRFTLRQ